MREKIIICHVVPTMNVGGAETCLYNLIVNSSDVFEHSVVCVIEAGILGEKLLDDGYNIVSLNIKSIKSSWRGLSILKRELQSIRPDIVNGWMYHSNVYIIISSWLARLKAHRIWCILHAPTNISEEKTFTSLLIRSGGFFSRFVDRIIYNSYSSAELHERFGYARSKREVILNGFDTDRFKPRPYMRNMILEKLGIDKNAILIGRVGRFHPRKDYKTLIEAFEILNREHKNIHLILTGKDINHNNAELAALIQESRVQDRVHLLDFRGDVENIHSSVNLEISSSRTESFPTVIGEAMSSAVPCVVTNVGDSAAIIGDTGRVVQPRNPLALADACSEMLSLGRLGLEELGVAARNRIKKRFSISANINAFEKIYHDIYKK